MKQSENTDAQWKGKRKTHFFSVQKVFPIFLCLQSFRFSYRSEWKVGQGQVLSGLGAVGGGQQSEKEGPE